MGKVVTLLQKLESIPNKREMRNLVGTLKRYSELTSFASTAVSSSITSRNYIDDVFKGAVPDKFTSYIASTRNFALRIIQSLEGDPAKINEKKVADRFDELKDAIGRAQANLKESWKKSIETKVTNYGPLIDAAIAAKMTGAGKFQKSLNDLKVEASNIPSNTEDADRVKNLNTSLEESLSDLGLAGKGGEFLRSATDGTANAQDLRDPEVIEFLDKYALWKAISIGLK